MDKKQKNLLYSATFLIFIASVFSVVTADAQSAKCAPTDDVVALLRDQFGETAGAMGLSQNGFVTQMVGNPGTGTWSAVVQRPDGVSCIVAAGTGFVIIPPAPEGDPA